MKFDIYLEMIVFLKGSVGQGNIRMPHHGFILENFYMIFYFKVNVFEA